MRLIAASAAGARRLSHFISDAVADVVILVGVFEGVCRRGLRRVGDNAPYQLGGRGELVADLEQVAVLLSP